MPIKIHKGDVKRIATRPTSNLSISNIIIIAGLTDNRTMNKNKRRKLLADTSKTDGSKRKHFLK